MAECDICIVIGYSFRDDSTKDKLKELLKADKKLIVVDKLAWENLGNNFLKPSFEAHEGDRALTVDVGGNNDLKKIYIIPEYINTNNMDDIVRRISRFI
jgi:DNA-binding protein YbaB